MIYTLTINPALDREMIVPQISFDQVLRAKSVKIDYGGKGFNVSRALLALGTASTALGFVGGSVGEQMILGLSQMGIPTDFIHVRGETRINLSVVNADHSHYIKVNEPGPMVSEAEAAMMLEKISLLARPGDWWVIAGSAPPGISPGFVAGAISLIQQAGARCIVDMEGEYLHQACVSRAFLVKPNQLEAAELIGKPVVDIPAAVSAVTSICMIGAQQVVISMGKAGAAYFDGSQVWTAEPPQIRERNPIGSGDALLAGMLWAFQMHLDGRQILRWGVACGSAAASLDGTAVGSLQQVQSLVDKVVIRAVDNKY